MSGKSGTMLPCTACSRSGQFCHEGSCGCRRWMRFPAVASSAISTSPRQPSIQPRPRAPAAAAEGLACRDRQIFRYAAGYDSVHQVAVAEELGVGPQQVFLQPPELEKAERKRDIVAEVAEVTEVVGDALELEQDAAQRQRAP